MNNFRKFFQRLRTLLWTALTLLTVFAAVVVGIGKLLMPYSAHYQPELEAWLSKSFNQPVRVESFGGEWKAFGPRIILRGVTLMPEGMKSEIAINRAALDIKPLNALIPGRPLYSFRIIGADLSLVRSSDGRYVLSGLGVSNNGSGKDENPGLRDVALNGEVRLQDITLSFDDPERAIHLVLSDVNGRLTADGRRVSAEINASVTDRDRNRVIGDLDATAQVRLDSEQHLAEAQWHVKTGELILAELVRQLPPHPLVPVSGSLNAEVWGEWQQGSPQLMQGVFDLREAQLSSHSGPLTIDHLNSRFNFQFVQRKDWRLDLSEVVVEYAGDQWQSERFSLARNLPQNLGLWVSSDFLELEFPLLLTQRIIANYNTPWPAAIPKRAQGNVTDFDLVLDAKWRVTMASAQLEDGRFWGWDKGPDIEGINAQVELDTGVGDVSFSGQSVKLDWLRTFRRPVVAAFTDCKLEVQWVNKTDWQFDLNYCHVENDDINGFGRVRMAWGEGKPNVDINVAMTRGDISRFGDYWPENMMGKTTLRWLRTSLLSGQVFDGRYSMVGDLDDFPFLNNDGRLQALAPFRDMTMKYADDWPYARQVDGIAIFEGRGMLVEGKIGNSVDTVVDKVTASIDDFKKPVLDVTYRTSTTLPDLVRFIRYTPLLDGLELNPEQFVFEGESEIDGHLHMRLGDSSESLQVNGSLLLKDNQFTELASGVVIGGIKGKLDYTRDGLKATALPGMFRGYPIHLDIASNWASEEVFRAHVFGDLPVDIVIPEELFELEPLFYRATGTSHWDVSLSVASVEGFAEREIWLEVYSGLEGVSIDLPAPMAKSGDLIWPLVVRYPIRADQHILSADFPGRVQLKMELSKENSRPVRAAVELGGEVEALPDAGLFSVNGSTAIFDLDGWIDLSIDQFADSKENEGLSLQSAQLDAGLVSVFDRQFYDVGLEMKYEEGIISGIFESQDINGTVRYYKNEEGSHSMSGEFERLIMPDPVTEGLTVETDPGELPEMHFYCKEFSYLGLDMGETRIEGYPVANGFHIETVEARSPSFIFNARGDWIRDDKGERSDFNIRISSESLGTVLEAMDISSAMRGGQTLVHFDAWWQGPPASFALERLNGEMDVSVTQGNILTANAGAGRMLGLLSLTELPRRLAMDFRDVFDEGFSFDEAKGTMKFENGISRTDDMTLSSTAAEISILGSTDLVAETFDYEFVVRPGVSKTLPVIGAIAGGPIGAAAGLALQALLRNALGEAAEARYTIRGTWDDPQIEAVEKPSRNGSSANAPEEGSALEKQAESEQSPDTGESGLQSKDGNNYD
ncbi:YhdP family protein [Pseudomonadota bacterium]